jgi:hypothetical protein
LPSRQRTRQLVGPPERATWIDVYRIGLGLMMIPLGISILVGTFASGNVTPPGVAMGLAFTLFGAYRIYVGVVRYRQYRQLPHVRVKQGATKPPHD